VTSTESSGPLSKPVKALRDFEACFLSAYQAYLQTLERLLQGYDQEDQDNGTAGDSNVVRKAALECLSSLLKTHPHFNFRVNILAAVVGLMSSPDKSLSALACASIEQVFERDESSGGEVSLEAVRLVSRLVKSRGFRVRAEVVKTFLKVRVSEEVTREDVVKGVRKEWKEGKKKKKGVDAKRKGGLHVSKKMRKVGKELEEVEKEMKEAEAEYSFEERQKRVMLISFLSIYYL
jgi:nucleolar complex protein 3